MTLLDGDSLADIFELPIDEILALPDLLLDDLELGPDRIDDLMQRRPPARRPVIHIPGFDDIIHIVPESFLPEEEQRRRQRDRAIRIRESPTPESVRAIGAILTFVDDIQDALLTLAVLARLGSVFYKPLIPVSAGLGAAAEAINIFGLASNIGAAPLTGKFRTASALRAVLGAQIVRGLRNPVLQRAIPTIGELVQILQTTDQLFGVGLSLGPIVGLFEDLIFGLPQGADFAFGSGIRYRSRDEVFLREEDQRRAEALQLHPVLGSLAGAARAASWVLSAPAGLSFSDRADALVLLNIVAELARGFIPESNWEPIVTAGLDRDRPPTRQLRPNTSVLLYQLGVDPFETETYPLPDNPRTLTPRQEADALARTGPQAIARWIQEAPSTAVRVGIETLANDLGFRMIRAFEGAGVGFETHGSPEWRATIDSLELGLFPPVGSPRLQSETYIREAAELYRPDPTIKIPQSQLQDLHARIFK